MVVASMASWDVVTFERLLNVFVSLGSSEIGPCVGRFDDRTGESDTIEDRGRYIYQ
jgi:hypothetical protein